MADLVQVRLLKAYRGTRAGTVVHVTAGLADHLVHSGRGVLDRQATLLPADGRQAQERAVAEPVAIETR